MSYGADATFAVCLEPACPKVTPKTLALQNMAAARASSAANAGVAGTAAWPATARAEPGASPSQVVVTFASGSAVLTTGAKAVLSSALARHGAARRITVAGHTDSTGSASLNKALATARAKAVLGFLVVQALSPKPAVEVEAQGACCFTAPNDSEAGRLRNRRVEVTFYGQGA